MSGIQGLALFHGAVLIIMGLGAYIISMRAEKRQKEKNLGMGG